MTQSKTILDLKKGEKAKLKSFKDSYLATKMISMGILPNSSLQLIRKFPLGGSYYIKVDGNTIAIRKSEAESIEIE